MRLYRCLACDDRPVMEGKVSAHLHVNEHHRGLLDSRHVDEFLEGLPGTEADVVPKLDGPHPPFRCRYCDSVESAIQESTILHHLSYTHEISKGSARYGVDYVSHDDYQDELREAALQRERELDAAVLALRSIDTVGDFLTECRS
jgi:hypothetical protein